MKATSRFCSILPARNHHPQYFYRHRVRSRRHINQTIYSQPRTSIGTFTNPPVSPNRRCLLPSHLPSDRLLPAEVVARFRFRSRNSATLGLATENGRRNPKNSQLVPIVFCSIIIKAIVENLLIPVENPPFPVENSH